MTDTQISLFIEAVEAGSINKAAAACFMTPPGLMRQLNALERSLDVILLERGPKGVTLTDAGKAFFDAAVSARSILQGGIEQAQDIQRRMRGTIKLVCSEGEGAPFVSQFGQMADMCPPRLSLRLCTGRYCDQLEGIASGLWDVTVFPDLWEIETYGLAFHPVYQDAIVCVISRDDPLSSRGFLTLGDIEDRAVLVEKGTATEKVLVAALQKAQETGIVLNITESEFGVAEHYAIVHGAVKLTAHRYAYFHTGPTCAVPVDLPPSTYGFVYRREQQDVMESFFSFADEILARWEN